MEEVGIHSWMWLQKRGQHFVKLVALYVFTSNENRQFLELVASIKASTRYVAAFKKHVARCKLLAMKSHDHHVMIQQILLMCVWNLLMHCVHQIIIILKKCFQKISVHVLNPVDILALKTYVAKRLSMFEMWFPPSFFNVIIHLLVHLVEIWKFMDPLVQDGVIPSKRVLKWYMWKKIKLESNMAMGYMYHEALGFGMEYLSLYKHTHIGGCGIRKRRWLMWVKFFQENKGENIDEQWN